MISGCPLGAGMVIVPALKILKQFFAAPTILLADKRCAVSAATKIEVKPYGNSAEYRAAEVYRGIDIEVIYCYLANPTSQKIPEETLGWRYFLPDASYWMHKFATPEEAFLKGRETVDLRLRQGTLVPNSEPKPVSPVLTKEAGAPEERASQDSPPEEGTVASPSSPPPVYERIDQKETDKWSKRANWSSILALLATFSASRTDTLHYGLYFDLIFALLFYPVMWAILYGCLTSFVWLYRCVTFNQSKKPLWNRCATWAIAISALLALLVAVDSAVHPSWGVTHSIVSEIVLPAIVTFYVATSLFYGIATGFTYLWRSRTKVHTKATRRKWILQGLALPLIIIVLLFGRPILQWIQDEFGQSNVSSPATLQPFDEHLSLTMPVAFGPSTAVPLDERFTPEMRAKILATTIRQASFNGVNIAVAKVTTSGIKTDIDNALWYVFSHQSTSKTMPKIDRRHINGLCESGAITFTIIPKNQVGQMTAVAISSENEDTFWTITAGGAGEAAELADKTAREFTFK